MTDYESNSITKLNEAIASGKWSNEGMVKLIKLCVEYLNPISLQEYADQNNITYQGALKRGVHVEFFGRKTVFDND